MKRVVRAILLIFILLRLLQQLYFRTEVIQSGALSDAIHMPISRRVDTANLGGFSSQVGEICSYTDRENGKMAQISHLNISRQGGVSDTVFFLKKELMNRVYWSFCQAKHSIDVWKLFFEHIHTKSTRYVTAQFQYFFDSKTSNILMLLLLGGGVDRISAVNHLLRVTGTQYLFVISGFHLNYILQFCSKLYQNKLSRTATIAINMFFAAGYGAFLGFSSSILRAVIMFMLYQVAKSLLRQTSGMNTLVLTLLIILLTDISILSLIGLQLSLLAVTGIVLLNKIKNYVDKSTFLSIFPSDFYEKQKQSKLIMRIYSYLIDHFIISLSVLIMIFPVLAFHFGEISLVSFIASAAIAWSIPILIQFSFLSVAMFLVFPAIIVQIFTPFIQTFTSFVVVILEWCAPAWALFQFDKWSGFTVLTYYLTIILIYRSFLAFKKAHTKKKYAKIYSFDI